MSRDLDYAGAGMLTIRTGAAATQGQEHRMGGHRRVSHKRRLFSGIEESKAYIVVRAAGCEHKRDLGVGELARDARHDRGDVPAGS